MWEHCSVNRFCLTVHALQIFSLWCLLFWVFWGLKLLMVRIITWNYCFSYGYSLTFCFPVTKREKFLLRVCMLNFESIRCLWSMRNVDTPLNVTHVISAVQVPLPSWFRGDRTVTRGCSLISSVLYHLANLKRLRCLLSVLGPERQKERRMCPG